MSKLSLGKRLDNLYHFLLHRFQFKRLVTKPRGRSNYDAMLTGLQLFYNIKRYDQEPGKWFTIAPKRHRSDISLFYLHGGSFVNGLHPIQILYIRTLVDRLNCEVLVPEYPLAPEHSAEDIFALLDPLYRRFRLDRQDRFCATIGDSAGGTLAIELAQRNLGNERILPHSVILLSPWLDISMTNPEIIKAEKKDPILGVQSLSKYGRWYAGDLDPADPQVSPIYGEMYGLPPVLMLSGTADILNPDARRMSLLLKKASVDVTYHEYDCMIHVWFFFEIFSQTHPARQLVIDFIECQFERWNQSSPVAQLNS